MCTSNLSTTRYLFGLLFLLTACTKTTAPKTQHPLDTVARVSVDTAHASGLFAQDSDLVDSPHTNLVHSETERERKERLFQERFKKSPKIMDRGVPYFLYTDSAGRKMVKVPGDPIPKEIKEK
jgi:hypothetical protein